MAAPDHSGGAMVALYPDPATARRLSLAGGTDPDDMHVTLAYLGDADEIDPETLEAIHQGVANWANRTPPINGEVSGYGLFTEGDDGPVTYASVDSPELPAHRQSLLEHLPEDSAYSNHGFSPHVTLDYGDRLDEADCGGEPLRFDSVALVHGGDRTDYPLAGAPVVASVSPRQFYPAPSSVALPEGLTGLTEASLRRVGADAPAPVREWADRVLSSIDRRVHASLVSAGFDCDDCGDDDLTAYGLIDPEFQDGELVVAVFRQPAAALLPEPGEQPLQRWSGSAWETVPDEMDPVGLPYTELSGPMLAEVLNAISAGATGVVLRPTIPKATVLVPTVAAAAPTPTTDHVYAIVDDLDNSAVLDVFTMSSDGTPQRRTNGEWDPDPGILAQLKGINPPQVVEIDPSQVATVLSQVDQYDTENAVTAAGWNETLHPRASGKFARKSQDQQVRYNRNQQRQQNVEDYVRNGGPLPNGLTDPTKKSKKGASSAGHANAANAAQARLNKAQALAAKKAKSRQARRNAQWAVEDAQRSLDRIKQDAEMDKAADAENARRTDFANSISDEYVRILKETGNPNQAQAAISAKVTAEINRRKKFDTHQAALYRQHRAFRRIQDATIRIARARAHAADLRPIHAAGTNPPSHSMMSENLKQYWVHGKGAAKIRWGTGGDFNRCRRHLAKYLRPDQVSGACANLHRAAVGFWPGKGRNHPV